MASAADRFFELASIAPRAPARDGRDRDRRGGVVHGRRGSRRAGASTTSTRVTPRASPCDARAGSSGSIRSRSATRSTTRCRPGGSPRASSQTYFYDNEEMGRMVAERSAPRRAATCSGSSRTRARSRSRSRSRSGAKARGCAVVAVTSVAFSALPRGEALVGKAGLRGRRPRDRHGRSSRRRRASRSTGSRRRSARCRDSSTPRPSGR